MVDDGDRVAGALDLVKQVRGQHDGPALVGQAGDHRPHLVHARRVEPVHRLVQDEQLGVSEQARGHAQALAHAHRVRGDLVVGALGEADPGQRRRDPPGRVAAARRGQQAQVLPPGQVVVEAGLVDDRADPGQRLAALGRDRDAEQRHRAGVGPGQAEQGADQRGLAGAVRAQVAEARTRAGRAARRRRRRRWGRTAWSGRGSRPPSRPGLGPRGGSSTARCRARCRGRRARLGGAGGAAGPSAPAVRRRRRWTAGGPVRFAPGGARGAPPAGDAAGHAVAQAGDHQDHEEEHPAAEGMPRAR